MGQIFSRCFFVNLFNRKKAVLRIGLLGLDNAGKTTILYQLLFKRHIETLPTVGFNVESVKCGKLLLNIWDICGGNAKTHQLWQRYNKNTAGIIFVVDAADPKRFHLAAKELDWLLKRVELKKVPILIYANKQDRPEAFSADRLLPLLKLYSVKQKWTLQECCALNGCGLWEGLEELQKMLLGKSQR